MKRTRKIEKGKEDIKMVDKKVNKQDRYPESDIQDTDF